MAGSVGNIETDIIKNGLVFNMDAANRASYVNGNTTAFNTIDLTQSGSFISDPTYISPPISASCWDFDGVDDYINCGDTSNLEGINGITIDTWVYPQIAGSGTALGIVSRDSGTRSWYLATYSSNKFRWFVSTNGSSNDSINSSAAFSLNTWYNVTVTWNNQGIYIYINGVFDSSEALVNTSPPLPNISEPLKIGDRQTGQEWNGQIANVKIYNRALSATEVLHNYNALKGRFE
jgi:hypothetical protein